MRQGVTGWNQETVGLIQYHPSIESLNAQLKCESGRGGQLHFHNIGNVGSSWITIDNRALESGLFQLSVEELATAIYWDLPIQLDQLFGLIHCHCYQTSLPSTLVNRHMLIPVSLAELFPCEASALNDNCEEALMYICERAEAEIKLPVDWRLKVIIIGRTFFLHC
eukprot:s5607_g1.t1